MFFHVVIIANSTTILKVKVSINNNYKNIKWSQVQIPEFLYYFVMFSLWYGTFIKLNKIIDGSFSYIQKSVCSHLQTFVTKPFVSKNH